MMKNPPYTEVDWSLVTPSDWETLTYVEIARKAGCSYSQVKDYLRNMSRSGKKLARTRRGAKFNWSAITPPDWRAMFNKEIAKKVGCSSSTVRTRRFWLIEQDRKAGKTGEWFVCAKTGATAPINWELLIPEDWRNMPNDEIAGKLGCRLTSTARRRRHLTKTPSGKRLFTYLKPPRPPGSRHDWDKIQRADWKALNNLQIARKVGCSLHAAHCRRKRLITAAAGTGDNGQDFICEQTVREKKLAPDWSLLKPQDWEMYNIEIARKLGCPAYKVSYQRKLRIAEEKRNRRNV